MKKKILSIVLMLTIAVSGCAGQGQTTAAGGTSANETAGSGSPGSSADEADNSGSLESQTDKADGSGSPGSQAAAIPAVRDTSGLFSDRDFETAYDENSSAIIQLNGTSASCSSDAVQISGSTVTILDEGTYILSGTLDDGMIIVNSEKSDKTRLVLNGVTIHSETSAPIYICQSDKVFITTAAGTVNTLSNGGTFTAIDENNIDAVIFSKEDLTLNGTGALTISSPAGHGIVSKDSLKITGGTFDITSASHALSGKDDICVTNADFTLVSGKDGIHAENADDTSLGFVYIQNGTFSIQAEGDGISASADMLIEDGSFDITAGGGSENGESHSSGSWGRFMGDGGAGRRDNAENRVGNKAGNEAENEAENRTGNETENEAGNEAENRTGNETENEAGNEIENRTENETENKIGNQRPENRPGGRPDESRKNEGGKDSASGSFPDNTSDSSTDSASMKGIKAADSLTINGGSFAIDSADDAVHSNASIAVNGGTFEIASGDDAFHADDTLAVTDGTILVTESYEGLEGLHVAVSGGDITLTASDDGLNAAGGTDASGNGGRDGRFGSPGSSSSGGSILISGGALDITAYGDGIDANGTLEITGGSITVTGPTQGDTSTLDYDLTGTISGGTFIGTGAAGMAQSFSSSEQGVIFVNIGNQAAGTEITLTDSEGTVILSHTPSLEFSIVTLSSPELHSGETYTLSAGNVSREVTAD